ncbi:MAG: NADH-quinone oxidoreductase subunit J [Elusimicrobiota bacterium]|jgi:NADH-quinone oxidoreductase subunit J
MVTLAVAVCAVAALASAGLAFFSKNLYSSAFCLLAVLLQVALLFCLLGSTLLGLLQLLVYAGGIMVLIVAAVTAVGPESGNAKALGPSRAHAWALLALCAVPTAFFLIAARHCAPSLPPAAMLEKSMARLLFNEYALLTEAVGLLVLVASLSVLKEQHD